MRSGFVAKRGGGSLESAIKGAKFDMEEALVEAVTVSAHLVENEATKGAPVKEGTLRASAHTDIGKTPLGVKAVISFNTPYAAVQEQREDFVHPMGGHAHYLSMALKSSTLKIAVIFKKVVGGSIK